MPAADLNDVLRELDQLITTSRGVSQAATQVTRAGESLRDRVRQLIKEDADRHRDSTGDDVPEHPVRLRKPQSVEHVFMDEVLQSVCRKLGPQASFHDYSNEFSDRWDALSEAEKTERNKKFRDSVAAYHQLGTAVRRHKYPDRAETTEATPDKAQDEQRLSEVSGPLADGLALPEQLSQHVEAGAKLRSKRKAGSVPSEVHDDLALNAKKNAKKHRSKARKATTTKP